MNKTKTIRVLSESLEALEKTGLFPKGEGTDLTLAVNTGVSFYLQVRSIAIARMKGLFTREEMLGLIQSYNGSMFDFQIATQKVTFLWHLEDSIKLENIDTMYGFDPESIMEKARKLDPIQCLVLVHEISMFWESGMELETFLSRIGC